MTGGVGCVFKHVALPTHDERMEKSIILIVLLSLLPFEGNMERVAAQRVDGIECDFNAFAKLK